MSPQFPSNAAAQNVALWVSQWALDVYRYCRKFLRNDAEAEDVMQLVFLQAYEDFETFRGQGSARHWLLSIARNRCLDRLKVNRRNPASAEANVLEREPTTAPPIDEALAQSQAARELSVCLDGLPDHARVAIVLRYQDELSYEEIERVTGVSVGALRVRVLRALPTLKECLEAKGVKW
jgi:RNA polymerase sigma-70 factor (ECF subfamily)